MASAPAQGWLSLGSSKTYSPRMKVNRFWLASAASILKSAKNMDEETRQAVTHAAGLLLSSAKDGLLRVVLEQEAEKGE